MDLTRSPLRYGKFSRTPLRMLETRVERTPLKILGEDWADTVGKLAGRGADWLAKKASGGYEALRNTREYRIKNAEAERRNRDRELAALSDSPAALKQRKKELTPEIMASANRLGHGRYERFKTWWGSKKPEAKPEAGKSSDMEKSKLGAKAIRQGTPKIDPEVKASESPDEGRLPTDTPPPPAPPLAPAPTSKSMAPVPTNLSPTPPIKSTNSPIIGPGPPMKMPSQLDKDKSAAMKRATSKVAKVAPSQAPAEPKAQRKSNKKGGKTAEPIAKRDAKPAAPMTPTLPAGGSPKLPESPSPTKIMTNLDRNKQRQLRLKIAGEVGKRLEPKPASAPLANPAVITPETTAIAKKTRSGRKSKVIPPAAPALAPLPGAKV